MSRSRWIKRVLAGALAISAAGGCRQQLFMEPADYSEVIKVALPKNLETNPHGPIVPGDVGRMADPANVGDFVRPPRQMTLRECVAIALEQGNVGGQSPQQFGFKNDTLAQSTGRTVGGTDAIRAFAVDPAIAAAEIERSLSRFDARWVSSMQWQKLDQPVAAQFLSFQQSRDAASLNTTLAKPLPTGGVAGITFSTDYSKFSQQAASQTSLINPNYTPRLQFSVEQPLLRLFGVEINQISSIGPLAEGSQILPGIRAPGGVGSEGILITRLRLDQARADFDGRVNFMLANVEAAYWNLYAAYYNLYAQEEGLRQAFEGFRFVNLRVEIGTSPPQDLDQIQAQFHRFQRLVYQARGQVLESERQLRGLLGLRSDDGVRIVPIDEPNLAPYKPDFHEAANDAIAMRPELMLARQELKFRQLDLMLQRNLRRPDLRGFATYDLAGLGTRLGGTTDDIGPNGQVLPGNALGSFIDNRFNSWTIGFRLDMPLGFRDANALVRQAQLNLTRSYVQLRDGELKAIEYLAFQYRRVIQSHYEIAPARAERESLQRYLWRIREVIRLGGPGAGGAGFQQFFLSYLTVQQQLAAAISTEAQAIANYNTALAAFEFAKGTIQQYNNVSVGEGPLPPWVQKRAADHIRERTEAAIKLREQPLPPGGVLGGHPVAPAGGTASVLSLPPFAEKREPLPDMLPPRAEPKNGKKPTDSDGLPPPRPLPGMNTGGAFRPLPTYGAGATNSEDYFKPGGRVTLPQPQPGSRPYPGVTPALPPGGAADEPGDYFKPDGRATLPRPKGGVPVAPPATAAPGGTAGGPEDYFKPDGRATIPPPPKRPGDPVWAPPAPQGSPEPAPAPVPGLPPDAGPKPPPPPAPAQGAAAVPLPPVVPPTLPPIPTPPGGQ